MPIKHINCTFQEGNKIFIEKGGKTQRKPHTLLCCLRKTINQCRKLKSVHEEHLVERQRTKVETSSLRTLEIIFFFFLTLFALGGSPTPHPISSRPHFVCKFSRHGSSSPVTSKGGHKIVISLTVTFNR
jgi:hypothetical protein